MLVHRLMEGGMETIYAVNPKGLGVEAVPGYTSILEIEGRLIWLSLQHLPRRWQASWRSADRKA